MVTAPAVTPFTMPVVEPMVAFALLALHVPPAVAFVSVILEPSHTLGGPPIVAGSGNMVTGPIVFWQVVTVLVASTVYVPGVVCGPKFIEAPVPATGPTIGNPSRYNW